MISPRHARVAVVAREPELRDALCAAVWLDPSILKVRSAAEMTLPWRHDGVRGAPQLVLLAIVTGETDGADRVRQALDRWPNSRVLVAISVGDIKQARRYLAAGASGCAILPGTPQEIAMAVGAVLAHHPFLSPSITEEVIQGYLRSAGRSTRVRRSDLPPPRNRGAAAAGPG
jgi:DNA-binding NarL/FixJ family response regulator